MPNPNTTTEIDPAPQGMINISGDTVVAATKDLPEAHAQAILWLFGYAREQGWSFRILESEVKLSTTTLFRVFKGQYSAALDNVVEKITTFRKLVEERGTANDLAFVETSVSRKVFRTCEWALVSQTLAFIYGNSQIGKTVALEEYARRNNHGQTKLVRMPASAGVQLFMKELAKACYVSPNSSFENLRERVLNSITGNNLIIVDELHQVFLSYQRGSAVKCLEVLREIHDRTKCGMVLCGTTRLRHELMLGQHQEMLEQFKRRGVLEVLLPAKPPGRDVEAIAKAFGLGPMDETSAALAEDILRASGLGKFTKFLQAGRRMADKAKERMSWNHFIRAHDILKKLSEGA